MCTDEDYEKTLNSMDRIHMSPGFVPLLGCRLLSQLLELIAETTKP